MSMNDPIADLLTRLRNANMALHEEVVIPSSKIKLGIIKILKENGFIKDFTVEEDGRQNLIHVSLKYGLKQERVMIQLERVSKCGRRMYVGQEDVPRVQGGLGIAILTTSKGVMTDREARKQHLGGELLCKVW